MSDRAKFGLFGAFAGFAVVVAFGVGLISMAAFDTDQPQPAAASGETVAVELGDLYLKPATLTTPAGDVTFEVTNKGAIEHNFAIEGVAQSAMIAPGESVTLRVPDLEAGTYDVLCQVAGHADAGLSGTLVVAGSDSGTAAAQASGMSHMSPEEMVEHDAAVTGAFPAETKGVGGSILEPVMDGGVKVFELTADEIEWETEPGVFKEAMAYNGIVPGPQINAELGDRVRIVLHNELAEPTTIHFHGMTVPNDMDGVPVINQDAVMPGKSFEYEFTVRNTGSHMYHSHFNAATQVPMGLLGALIVADPDDPAVDQDVTMILNDGPLGYTLNGKGFPATAPIVAEQGRTFRVRYMNEGLQIHPMHMHGLVQRVIAKDGHLLEHTYVADTVLVAPGERYDVIVRATEPGAWAFHCHILNHVEGPDGMFGMVTAVIVQ